MLLLEIRPIRHRPFPGGKWLRTPALVPGMASYRLRDVL
jgi:gamma-glutamylputrescine oxidase